MSLLGGGDTKSETRLGKYAKNYLDPLNKGALDSFQSGAPNFYDFNTVAGFDPFQSQGINQLGNYGQNMGGDIANQMFSSGMAGGDILSNYYGNPVQAPQVGMGDINQFYNSDLVNSQVGAATDSAYQLLDRYLGNDVASGAIASGNTSSSRRGMIEGQAIGDTATGLAGVVGGIQNQGWGNAMNLAGQNAQFQAGNNALNANNMANYGNYTGNALSNAYNFGTQNANNAITAGSLNQAQNQAGINAQMDNHLWDYNMDWDLMNRYFNIASPNYGLQKSTNTPGTPGLGAIGTSLGSAWLASGGRNPFSSTTG